MRYYYTDPLAAAYMAKHYCMKFRDNDGETLESDRDVLGGGGYYDPVEGNIEVHPDSLHLLEPKAGDIGIVRSGDIDIVCDYTALSTGGFWFFCETRSFEKEKGKIIYRNGKPFFWPEVEHD